jgi:hypothetical protein
MSLDNPNKYIIGWEAMWEILIGFTAYCLITSYVLLEGKVFRLGNAGIFESFAIWSRLIFYCSFLLIIVVCNFYCKKNNKGKFVINEIYPWTLTLVKTIGAFFFVSLGWVIATSITMLFGLTLSH